MLEFRPVARESMDVHLLCDLLYMSLLGSSCMLFDVSVLSKYANRNFEQNFLFPGCMVWPGLISFKAQRRTSNPENMYPGKYELHKASETTTPMINKYTQNNTPHPTAISVLFASMLLYVP